MGLRVYITAIAMFVASLIARSRDSNGDHDR